MSNDVVTKQQSASDEVKVKRRPPRAGMGRPKGTPNKTTVALKEAILLAAESAGEDGCGSGGLTGYLRSLAVNEPRAFSSLLGRVLPLQVSGAGPNGEHVFSKIIVEVVKAQ